MLRYTLVRWKWRPSRRRSSGADDPTADLAAFLLGRSASFFQARREPVPPWASLNAVAHGDADAVAALSRGDDPVARIATALSRQARGEPGSIRQLQTDLLVPLELALLSGRVSAADSQGVAKVAIAALRTGRCPPAVDCS